MADTSITSENLEDGSVLYAIGRSNWDPEQPGGRQIPDSASPERTVQLEEDAVIDVVVLGDGYTTQGDFEAALRTWVSRFFAVEVYQRFAGAFRIRALYSPSKATASRERHSYYGVLIDEKGKVSNSGWWQASGPENDAFRDALFGAIERFSDRNRRRYPAGLDVGGSATVIHNELGGMYRNLVACMLVLTADPKGTSGRTRAVPEPGASGVWLNVAFGDTPIHEFGHAFAYLEDEYISGRNETATRHNPTRRSLFTLSNLSFDDWLGAVPWEHLSPWGLRPRQAAGNRPSPVLGWLWLGGEQGHGVWHSEYECLMNGSSSNYRFTQVAADDAATKDKGADLRSPARYCLWCQEIVVARILEKTGQLEQGGAPADTNERGRWMYDRWGDTWRERYWAFFDVDAQIARLETQYAAMTPGQANEALWRSDLYHVPRARARDTRPAPAAVEDDELLLFMQG